MNKLIADAYLNLKNPYCFSSVAGVKRAVPAATHRQIRERLQQISTFTLHKPVRHRYERRKTIGAGIGFCFQVDLIQYSGYAKENDGITFILALIDVYSKKIYLRPLLSKSATHVSNALEKLLNELTDKPIYIFWDKGKEFKNAQVLALLKKHGIREYSPDSPMKCSVIERAIKTIRGRIEKYMVHHGTRRYVDILPDIESAINHSYNRSIRMRPVDVTSNFFHDTSVVKKPQGCTFDIGDTVRISVARDTFQKGFASGWSHQEYIIHQCMPGNPTTYRIKDIRGDPIGGIFYEPELTHSRNDDEIYKVEAILQRRVRQGKRQVLIKWLGYDDSFNSWENQDDVTIL